MKRSITPVGVDIRNVGVDLVTRYYDDLIFRLGVCVFEIHVPLVS